MRAPDKSQWQPILNEQQEQVGWVIDGERIKYPSHKKFMIAEGYLTLALMMKEREQARAKKEQSK